MEVYKFNHVFDHVEITLRELLDSNPKYNNTLFVLGYNVLKDINFLRTSYPGFKIIVYQLEQLYNGSPWVNKQSYSILKQVDEIWDYDQSNIAWMRDNYKLNAKFVPLLFTKSLKKLPSINEIDTDIDVLFYGYMHERRAKLVFNLQQKFAGKYKLFDLYGVWGDELDSYIARSKIILNIHAGDKAKQEQARMYYPVINGRCVLSEVSPYNYLGDSIVELQYKELSEGVQRLLRSGKWKSYALSASDRFHRISDSYINKIQF